MESNLTLKNKHVIIIFKDLYSIILTIQRHTVSEHHKENNPLTPLQMNLCQASANLNIPNEDLHPSYSQLQWNHDSVSTIADVGINSCTTLHSQIHAEMGNFTDFLRMVLQVLLCNLTSFQLLLFLIVKLIGFFRSIKRSTTYRLHSNPPGLVQHYHYDACSLEII